jgi:hypothetical protein
VWALITAIDFRARLRFPQAVGEPNTLFPQESSFCTPINRWNKLKNKGALEKSIKKPELI